MRRQLAHALGMALGVSDPICISNRLEVLKKAQARHEQRYWHTDKPKAAAHAIKVDRFALWFELKLASFLFFEVKSDQ